MSTSDETPPAWRAFTPEDSPKTPADIMSDPAHDIDLPICDFSDGVENTTGERFQLLARAGERPVALIFGSYT